MQCAIDFPQLDALVDARNIEPWQDRILWPMCDGTEWRWGPAKALAVEVASRRLEQLLSPTSSTSGSEPERPGQENLLADEDKETVMDPETEPERNPPPQATRSSLTRWGGRVRALRGCFCC